MIALRAAAAASWLALIALTVAWEMGLAPLRPHGSWLVLKAVPLALAAGGIVSGTRYTYQWALMLVLAYAAEGIVRAYAETGMTRILASSELALSLVFFVTALAYVRTTRAGPLSSGEGSTE